MTFTIGGGSWNPRDISSVALWLRADMGITLNGANVSTWANQTSYGSGRNYTQSDPSLQPYYDATGGPLGTPVISTLAEAAAQKSLQNNNNTYATLTEGHFFVVWKAFADPPNLGGGDNGSAWFFGGQPSLVDHYTWTTGDVYSSFGSNSRFLAGNPATNLTNWNCIEQSSKSNDWNMYVDGSLLYHSGSNTVAWRTESLICGWSASGGSRCAIAEIIIFGSVLTSPQRANVISYVNGRYGLSVI
jgi:hypothetical protein